MLLLWRAAMNKSMYQLSSTLKYEMPLNQKFFIKENFNRQILESFTKWLPPLAIRYSLRGIDGPCLVLWAVFGTLMLFLHLNQLGASLGGDIIPVRDLPFC